jgi:hypothetical protein
MGTIVTSTNAIGASRAAQYPVHMIRITKSAIRLVKVR